MRKFQILLVASIYFLLNTSTVFAGNGQDSNSFASAAVNINLLKILVIYILGLIITATLIFTSKIYAKNKIEYKDTHLIKYITMIALTIRIIIAPIIEGHDLDMNCFKAWASMAANDLTTFYVNGVFADYPPLYMYVLFIVEKIRLSLGNSYPLHIIMIKLPSILADVVTGYLIYTFSNKLGKTIKSHPSTKRATQNSSLSNKSLFKTSILLSSAYLFNPVTILDSAVWGQVDGFFTMLLLFGIIYMIEERLVLACFFYALAILMKPQGLIFLPILFFVIVKKKDVMLFLKCLGTGVLTFVLPLIPFSIKQEPFWIFKLYFNTASNYKGASINAFNLFVLFGANWKDDSLTWFIFSYSTWGFIFIGLVTAFSACLVLFSDKLYTPVISSIAIITGVFMLSSKMHERYLFPCLALLLIVYAITNIKPFMYIFIGFTITNFINIFQVLYLSFSKVYWVPVHDLYLIIVSIANLVLLGFTYYLSYKLCLSKNIKIGGKP